MTDFIRVPNPNAPVQIDRELALDDRLSLGGRGLYLYLVAREEAGEEISISMLADVTGSDRVADLERWFHELIACGYLASVSS
jgi:hypothetical protein